jgi:hypothetical protein
MSARRTVFPFGEFDPVLRRDLNAVLHSVSRDLEEARIIRNVSNRDELRKRLVHFLKDSAERGERCPFRLYEGAIRQFAPEVVSVH